MPNKYLKIFIDDEELQPKSVDDFPISISYKLEDPSNFQSKKSSESLSITLPATLNNDKIGNAFHNPSIEDMTSGQIFRSYRKAVMETGSCEIFVGKAILTDASHTYRPEDYTYDFYGNNGDWIISLQDKTMFDYLQHLEIMMDAETIEASWAYDGTSEDLPYVFAPVRYAQPMDNYTPVNTTDKIIDYSMSPTYLRPSISVYWLFYWTFKSLGYKIQSDFFNTNYFRRLVMPWTWGSFLNAEGPLQDNLDFLAKSTTEWSKSGDFDGYADLPVTNVTTDGAFDNTGVYSYDSVNKRMKWTYLGDFGLLNATLKLTANLKAKTSWNSHIEIYAEWMKNDDPATKVRNVMVDMNETSKNTYDDTIENSQNFNVEPGDYITCKIFVHIFESLLGVGEVQALSVAAFEFDYTTIVLGSTVFFNNFSAFKNYKILDFIAGVIDLFNLEPGTDPINKVVYFEPTHPYSLTNDLGDKSGGYFNGDWLDWNAKQDLSFRSNMQLYSDYDRNLTFKFKDDTSDGILSVVQKRNSATVGSCKYVLPERFNDEKKEIENRFFSPLMHYDVRQWKGLSADTNYIPQMCCIIPENISNTSATESESTFAPKIAWYKGEIDKFWVYNATFRYGYPYMFGVNYKPGGEDDPVLSYCDELIDPEGTPVIAKGLLNRFYLQRMAIMRNGQYYTTAFRLNNRDVTNFLHREHIICRGERWELLEIKEYKPLQETTTVCTLRKWAPVSIVDKDNVFPSESSVQGTISTNQNDLKYVPAKCLSSDIVSES